MIAGTVVKGPFDIIRASKCWGKNINYFDKLSKTSRKRQSRIAESLKLDDVFLNKIDRSNLVRKSKASWKKESYLSFSYTYKK